MLLHQDLLGERDEVAALLTRLGSDNNLTVASLDLTHGDLTVDFADNSRVGRVASLEELGDTRQTTGDVTTFGSSTRNLDEGLTCLDGLSVLNHHVATHGEVVGTDNLAVYINHIAGRHLRLVLRLGHNLLGKTRCLIGLSTEGDTLDDIVELQATGILSHDDGIEGIPLGNLVALGHLVAILEVERRTVGDVDRGEDNAGVGIDKAQLTESADHHLALASILIERHRAHLLKLNLGSVILGDDAGIGSCIGSHTTGVERTERQLGSRLTDGLGGNHADSLTLLHHAAGGEVASIALHADTLLGLTGEHRTDLDTLDVGSLDGLGQRLGDFLTGRHDDIARLGVDDIMHRHTAKDALRED